MIKLKIVDGNDMVIDAFKFNTTPIVPRVGENYRAQTGVDFKVVNVTTAYENSHGLLDPSFHSIIRIEVEQIAQ